MNGGQSKLAAALMSKILVIRFWKDTKFGTIANFAIATILFTV